MIRLHLLVSGGIALLVAMISALSLDSAGQTTSSSKRALLVGVSGYERNGGGWGKIATREEVLRLRETLKGKFGFTDDGILVLTTPEETTRESILRKFRSHLIDRTERGDVVYFHFSGHGQPIPDDGKDEPDGYDESLVPSDYVSKVDGSRNIRDDELGKLIQEVKAKSPASLLVSLDACYTGTATRGETEGRGDDWRGEPVSASRIKGEETIASGLDAVRDYVVLTAAAPRQSAKQVRLEDGRLVGLFTWSLIEALERSGPQTSYRDLHEAVTNRVVNLNRLQNPQAEGKIDSLLLNGTALRQEPYFRLSVERDGRVWLKGGQLQGITTGSLFAVYPEGTRSKEDAGQLAQAEVVEVEVIRSQVTLSASIPAEKLRLARAFETKHRYDQKLLRIATRDLDRVANQDGVRQALSGLGLTMAEGPIYDLLIRGVRPGEGLDDGVRAGFRGVIVEQQNGIRLTSLEAGPNLEAELSKVIEREWQLLTVRSLERGDPRLAVDLRIVPIEVEVDPQTRKFVRYLADKSPVYDKGGQLTLQNGSYFRVDVRNSGTLPVYVTILNLTSAREVMQIWPPPSPGQAESGNYLEAAREDRPAEWKLIQYYEVAPPLGLESFMVIGTTKPTDFSPLLPSPTRSAGSRGKESPLTRRLRALQPTRSRGFDEPLLDVPPDWATSTASFLIRE